MPMVLQSAPVWMRVSTVADDTDIPTKLYSQLLTCCMNSVRQQICLGHSCSTIFVIFQYNAQPSCPTSSSICHTRQGLRPQARTRLPSRPTHIRIPPSGLRCLSALFKATSEISSHRMLHLSALTKDDLSWWHQTLSTY